MSSSTKDSEDTTAVAAATSDTPAYQGPAGFDGKPLTGRSLRRAMAAQSRRGSTPDSATGQATPRPVAAKSAEKAAPHEQSVRKPRKVTTGPINGAMSPSDSENDPIDF